MIRICTNCGRAFSRRDLYCPYCGRTPYRFGRICPKGHHNPHNALFCATCRSQNLSELAPPVPLWRRLLVVFLIMGPLTSLWFLLPILLSGALHMIAGIIRGSSHIIFLAAVYLLIPFAITLFLPKHIGKYIRKVLFTLIRYSLRLLWFVITAMWRILAYFVSLVGGNVRGLQRGRG